MKQKQRLLTPWRAACFGVLLLAAVVYYPSMSGTFIWDDHEIMDGTAIGGGNSLLACFTHPFLENYYRPIVSASFVLEKPIASRTPFFYHQTNILLHVLTTGLLMLLLSAAFKRRSVAILGGLLFAVQPVQVSAVAWIGGRTDSLCALFMTLFAWLLIRAARTAGRGAYVALGGSACGFALALFTKEQVLPAILLVPLAYVSWSPEGVKRGWRALCLATLPFIGVAVLFLTLLVRFGPAPPVSVKEPLPEVLAQALRTICYYTLLLFAPTGRWMHSMSLGAFVRAGAAPLLGGIAVTAAAVYAVWRWRKREPAVAWFVAFILLTLVLVSNLYPVPSMLICPYRAGVAGVGGAALAAWALVGLTDRFRAAQSSAHGFGSPIRIYALYAVAAAAVVWCTGLCWWGAGRYSEEEAIARTIVQNDPDSIWARYNLTAALANKSKFHLAAVEMEGLLDRLYDSPRWRDPSSAVSMLQSDPHILRRMHELQGTRVEPREWLSRLYGRLGFARLDTEDSARALPAFQAAARIYPAMPDAAAGLGECAYLTHDYKTAIRKLKFAISLDETQTRARARLGKSYAALGRWSEAAGVYRELLRELPWAGGTAKDLAEAQVHLGDIDGAVATLRRSMVDGPTRSDNQALLAHLERARALHGKILPTA